MMSYLGISHRQYPGDLRGFLSAIGRVELIPMVGFIVPFGSLLVTRGLDISWERGASPPSWYGWQLVFCGFGFSFAYPVYMKFKNQLRRALVAEVDAGLDTLVPRIFSINSDALWRLFYRVVWMNGCVIFLLGMMMSWAFSYVVYFLLGVK